MAGFTLLIAQIATILAVSRAVGWLFGRFHQPRVIGEMVAGILLGPSLLGWLAPRVSATLFPAESLGVLSSLSQVGLLLFMFLVGLELDLPQLKRLGRAAVITSQVSIVVPFVLGALLALAIHPRVCDPSVGRTGFVLFMSVAMSITAFPVLARILTERNLLRTRVGALAITCAAVDDVTAWCLLAGIVVVVRSSSLALPLWATIVGLLAFVAVMVGVVRRLLLRLATAFERRGTLGHDALGLILLVMLASGWITESLGVHALFGAFLAGVVMPRHPAFARELWQRLETVTVVLLLPIYFACTGLRSSFVLIGSAGMWGLFALVLALAVLGKLGGSLAAARLCGMTWREAAAVGVLMNTRGLVELVILNIGLDLGVLSPALFSVMVLMALVTTFMTSPLLAWIKPDRSVDPGPSSGIH